MLIADKVYTPEYSLGQVKIEIDCPIETIIISYVTLCALIKDGLTQNPNGTDRVSLDPTVSESSS